MSSYIEKIRIENFMCFKGIHTLEFTGRELVGIIGAYDGDKSESNRSGKTAFLDSIRWCLYGKSRAKRANELIHSGLDQASVTIDLAGDRKQISVTRLVSKNTGGQLFIHTAKGEKKKATQEKLNEYLGMTWPECEATSFFKQNDIDQFLECDSTKKKEILLRWLSNTDWQTYENEAITAKKQVEARERDAMARLGAVAADAIDPEEVRGLLKENAESFESNQKDLSELILRRSQLEIKKRDFQLVDKKLRDIEKLNIKIKDLARRRPDCDSHFRLLEELNENLAKYKIVDLKRFEKAEKNKDKCIEKASSLNQKIDNLKNQIHSISHSMTGVCPILQESCSRIEVDVDKVENLKSEINDLQEKQAEVLALKDRCVKVMRLRGKQEEWQNEIDKINSVSATAHAIEEQIADIKIDIKFIEESIPRDLESQIDLVESELREIPERESNLQAEARILLKREAHLGEQIKQFNYRKKQRDLIEKQIADIRSDLADIKYVCYMFSKNGIPSIELENSYHSVERDANYILKQLKAPFRFEFEASRELADWEPACLRCDSFFERGTRIHVCSKCHAPREKKTKDELQIKVFEGDQERPFYLDSGGGKMLLSVALRLALGCLAKRRSGSNWSTLFLDEVFGPLDKTNRKKMAELITTVISKSLGFEQIFLISHDPEIQSATAKKLIVSRHKDENWSEINLA